MEPSAAHRNDTWQVNELSRLQNADSLVSTFQYETRDLRHDKVQSTMPPYEEMLVSLGLDGTVVSNLLPSMIRIVPGQRRVCRHSLRV